MPNGICIGFDTFSFAHVSRTKVLNDGNALGVWVAGVYIELTDDDAFVFQNVYRKWLGIPVIEDETDPVGNPDW